MPTTKENYEEYKRQTSIFLDYDIFMRPGDLVDFHEKHIGTVVRKFNQNLTIYPHILHFGCMFFFKRLTRSQLENGPTVDKMMYGLVCPV